MCLDPHTAERALEGRNRSSVCRGNLGDDGEPEPATTRIPGPGLVETNEPLEDSFAFGLRDPLAVVVDPQQDFAVGFR